jgi:hypothetical protein
MMLEFSEDHIVRAGVIGKYVLIDEFLTNVICRHFFKPKASFPKLWRTKKFRNFMFYIMEDLSLLKKLTIVQSIIDVPKPIAHSIHRVNSTRNALAHSFFPENRREHKPRGRVMYKGRDLFSVEGYKGFAEDAQQVIDFFVEHRFLG